MVLSLYHNCLLRIRNHVEHGRLYDVDRLPVGQRRLLFYCLSLRGEQLNNSHCLRCFGSEKFFDDFSIIDTASFRVCNYDSVLALLFQTVAESRSLAENLTELRLHVWIPNTGDVCRRCGRKDDGHRSSDFCNVCRLIGKCRNLRRLTLIGGLAGCNYTVAHRSFFRDLADVVRTVNIRLTRLACRQFCFDQRSTVDGTDQLFVHLTEIYFENSVLPRGIWRHVLQCAVSTLTSVSLVWVIGHGRYLPIAPINLRQLRVQTVSSYSLDATLLAALDQCQQLDTVHLEVSGHENDLSLSTLQRLPGECLRVAVDLTTFDPERQLYRFAACLDRNIVSLRLASAVSSVMADFLLSHFPYLSELDLNCPESSDDVDHSDRFLFGLFTDRNRYLKLRHLDAYWRASSATVRALFANCASVDVLRLGQRSTPITDDHLHLWTAIGAKPSMIELTGLCEISDYGLIPLLRNCAMNLAELRIDTGELTSAGLAAVLEHCRLIRKLSLPSPLLNILIRCSHEWTDKMFRLDLNQFILT